MKKFALAAAFAAASTTAFAGTIEEPIVEPVIVEETSGTGSAWVIPVILLALIAAAAAS